MKPPTTSQVAVVVVVGALGAFSWLHWRDRPVTPKPPPEPPSVTSVLDAASQAWRNGVSASMVACAAKCEMEGCTDVEAQQFLAKRFKEDIAIATQPIMAELAKSVVVNGDGEKEWSRTEFVRILRELADDN